MSKTGDFLIGLTEDAEYVIGGCEDFEQFCSKMKKLDDMYLPSTLVNIREEHVGSQEDLNVNHYIRRAR